MKMLALAAALVLSVGSFAQAYTSPAPCSNGGDQTSRPVFKRVKGRVVLVGYECVQDNGSSGGGVRF